MTEAAPPGLAALSLIVPDHDAAITFFRAGLGWDVLEDIDQGRKRWVTVGPASGGTRLVLAQADGAAQRAAIGRQGAGRVWLFLRSADFARDQARLSAAGAVFEERPRHEAYGTVAVWRAPWGNRWDLIGPPGAPKQND